MRDLEVRLVRGDHENPLECDDLLDPMTGAITTVINEKLTLEGITTVYRVAKLVRRAERDRQAAWLRKARHARQLRAAWRDLQGVLKQRGAQMGEVDMSALTPVPGAATTFHKFARTSLPVR